MTNEQRPAPPEGYAETGELRECPWCKSTVEIVRSLNRNPLSVYLQCSGDKLKEREVCYMQIAGQEWVELSSYLTEERLIELFNTRPSEPRWIPVEERLPEKQDIYLIQLSIGNIFASEYIERDKRFYLHFPFETMRVIAWRPLPASYTPTQSPDSQGEG